MQPRTKDGREAAFVQSSSSTQFDLACERRVVEQPIRFKDPKSEREQNFETHHRSV